MNSNTIRPPEAFLDFFEEYGIDRTVAAHIYVRLLRYMEVDAMGTMLTSDARFAKMIEDILPVSQRVPLVEICFDGNELSVCHPEIPERFRRMATNSGLINGFVEQVYVEAFFHASMEMRDDAEIKYSTIPYGIFFEIDASTNVALQGDLIFSRGQDGAPQFLNIVH